MRGGSSRKCADLLRMTRSKSRKERPSYLRYFSRFSSIAGSIFVRQSVLEMANLEALSKVLRRMRSPGSRSSSSMRSLTSHRNCVRFSRDHHAGCLRTSLADGRSSGFASKHFLTKSFASGRWFNADTL